MEEEEDDDPFLDDVLPEEADEYISKIQKFRQCMTSQVSLTSRQQDFFSTPAQKVEISGRIVNRKIYFRYFVDGQDVLKENRVSNDITSCCFEFDDMTTLVW